VRVLGLDIGSKRIGVAISDELGLTAQGISTLNFTTTEKFLEEISALAHERNITKIVVGMPYNMNGTEGPQALKIRAFMSLLAGHTNLEVVEWDERLSTAAAERVLLEADMSRSKRRKVVDKVAAVLILQGYLDNNWRGETICT
jgi:putative holliday junction resolvase